jgi:hypothetical protein
VIVFAMAAAMIGRRSRLLGLFIIVTGTTVVRRSNYFVYHKLTFNPWGTVDFPG